MRRGFSLIEMLIYTALLALIATLVAGAAILLMRSQFRLSLSKDVGNAAAISLERMTREVRFADSINAASSTLGSNPGVLVLNSVASGTAHTVKFSVSNGAIQVTADGVSEGSILPSDVTATNLVFRRVQTAESEAIRIEMTLQASRGGITYSTSFTSGAVLRGSY